MVEIVVAGGYDAVTVRKLAKLAKVSPGTFYAQFGGKEECFVSTYTMIMRHARGQVAASRLVRREGEEQLAHTLHGLVGGLTADPETAQFALVEAFGGGPAALVHIRAQEAELELAVGNSLERRERSPVPAAISSWIAAGSLGVARTWIAAGEEAGPHYPLADVAEWGRTFLDQALPDLAGSDDAPPVHPAAGISSLGRQGSEDDPHGAEQSLLTAATIRLAKTDGYWRLSVARIRATAGLSRQAFSHHFRDVTHCYLAAVMVLSDRYFGRLGSAGHLADWPARICREISGLCEAIAADPPLAKLVFLEVLAPGVTGMRCREELVARSAQVWRAGAPAADRPSPAVAEATIAALWSAIASHLDRGAADRLPREAATFSFFLLAPLIGAPAAIDAIDR